MDFQLKKSDIFTNSNLVTKHKIGIIRSTGALNSKSIFRDLTILDTFYRYWKTLKNTD